MIVLGDRRGLRRTLAEIDRLRRGRPTLAPAEQTCLRGASTPARSSTLRLTAAFALLFAVSGLLLWLGERNTAFRLDSTIVLHDALTYLSVFLLVGHLYLALIHRKTRHALRGITRGDVRRDWAREHHRKWIDGEPDPRA